MSESFANFTSPNLNVWPRGPFIRIEILPSLSVTSYVTCADDSLSGLTQPVHLPLSTVATRCGMTAPSLATRLDPHPAANAIAIATDAADAASLHDMDANMPGVSI